MIKFSSHDETGKTNLIGLGLSQENLNRLQQDKPILIKLKELKIHGMKELSENAEIIIFYGKTEKDIVVMLHSITGDPIFTVPDGG